MKVTPAITEFILQKARRGGMLVTEIARQAAVTDIEVWQVLAFNGFDYDTHTGAITPPPSKEYIACQVISRLLRGDSIDKCAKRLGLGAGEVHGLRRMAIRAGIKLPILRPGRPKARV